MNVFVYTHLMIITIFIVIKAGFMGKVKSIIHVFFRTNFCFVARNKKKVFPPSIFLSGSVFITQSLSHLPEKSLSTSIKHRIRIYAQNTKLFFILAFFSEKLIIFIINTHLLQSSSHVYKLMPFSRVFFSYYYFFCVFVLLIFIFVLIILC